MNSLEIVAGVVILWAVIMGMIEVLTETFKKKGDKDK